MSNCFVPLLKVEGKDDETGEDLIQREDDKPESVRNRLEVFQASTEPVLEFYRKMGILQVIISGKE